MQKISCNIFLCDVFVLREDATVLILCFDTKLVWDAMGMDEHVGKQQLIILINF